MKSHRSLPQLRKVDQVQQTRCQAAQRRFREQQAVCEELRAEAEARRQDISTIKQRLDALIGWNEALPEVTDAARLARPQSFRFWILFDLEREEYYLEQTLERLQAEEVELLQCKQRWLTAHSRAETLTTHIKQERSAMARQREIQQEIEWEDLPGKGVMRHV